MQSDCILLCLVIRIFTVYFGLVYNDIGKSNYGDYLFLRYDNYFRYINVYSNDVPLVNPQ